MTLVVSRLMNCVRLVVTAHTFQWFVIHTSLCSVEILLSFHSLEGVGRCSLEERHIVLIF